MFFKFPIFISLSPNVEKDDIQLALKLIFQPWKWKRGKAVRMLEEKFEQFLGLVPFSRLSSDSGEQAEERTGGRAFAFNSGRAAFLAILSALDLKKGDEVLLQAFTCNAAVNPIIWSGLRPVFVDIEKDTLNIDPQKLEEKISPKSRIVLVQHTFGLPAKIDEIADICRKYNLILIEDCAHSLGAIYRGRKVGRFGKAAFFSLGRDKVISSVYGGIAIAGDEELAEKIRGFQRQCPRPSNCWILQQLWHPILTKLVIIPLYGFFGLGKYILVGFQKLKFISKSVQKKEKKGKKPKYFPQKMPNSLALLALKQLEKVDRFNRHRQKIAEIYEKEAFSKNKKEWYEIELRTQRIYMRYSILVDKYDTDEVLKFFRKEGIFLDDGWRKAVIVPPGTNEKVMGYEGGTCPVAEEVADKIVNLPTHINISSKTAERIKNLLKVFK